MSSATQKMKSLSPKQQDEVMERYYYSLYEGYLESKKKSKGYSHPVSDKFYGERSVDRQFPVNNLNTVPSINGPVFTGTEYKIGSPRSPRANKYTDKW